MDKKEIKEMVNNTCDEILEVHYDRNDRAAIEMVRESLLEKLK